MSGLQVWDATGQLIFDETSPVIKFLGTTSIGTSYTGETTSGTITDARFTQYVGHVPFWARIDGGFSTDYYDAAWSFNGNDLTWTFPNPAAYAGSTLYNRPNQTIIYGIR